MARAGAGPRATGRGAAGGGRPRPAPRVRPSSGAASSGPRRGPGHGDRRPAVGRSASRVRPLAATLDVRTQSSAAHSARVTQGRVGSVGPRPGLATQGSVFGAEGDRLWPRGRDPKGEVIKSPSKVDFFCHLRKRVVSRTTVLRVSEFLTFFPLRYLSFLPFIPGLSRPSLTIRGRTALGLPLLCE